MSVYKFRVAYEDDNNIYRDIEILPNQTMRDLDESIVDSFKLPKERVCHLYKSNDNWQKLEQIDLHPKPVKKGRDVKIPMVMQYVDAPHQKFLYTFEGAKQEFSLLIELILITVKGGTTGKYPAIVKSVGPTPVKKDELLKHLSKNSVKEEEQFGIESDEEDVLGGMSEEGEDETSNGEGGDDNGETFENEFGFDESENQF